MIRKSILNTLSTGGRKHRAIAAGVGAGLGAAAGYAYGGDAKSALTGAVAGGVGGGALHHVAKRRAQEFHGFRNAKDSVERANIAKDTAAKNYAKSQENTVKAIKKVHNPMKWNKQLDSLNKQYEVAEKARDTITMSSLAKDISQMTKQNLKHAPQVKTMKIESGK